MNKSTASTLVLVTGGLLVVYALLDARNGNASTEVTYKRVYSSFLATVGLGIAADLVPGLVGPFAILVIAAAWAKHQGVLGGVLGATSAAAAPRITPGATGTPNAPGSPTPKPEPQPRS